MTPSEEELAGDVIVNCSLGGSGHKTVEMKKVVRKASSRVESLRQLVASSGKASLSG